MFGLGPQETWLSIHGLIFILLVGFASYVFGAIYFTKQPDKSFMFRLKVSSLAAFLLVVALMVSGVLPDMNGFAAGATLTGSWSNDYGNFTQTVSDVSVGNFTGPLLFDFMEHISFIGVALTGLVTFLIWEYGEMVVTDRTARWSVLSLILVTVAWLVVLGVVGTLMTKTLTFPPGV